MLSSINTNIGRNHIHLDSVDSTNIYAKNLIAKSNPIEGTVISADFQTDGKGQFDRKWHSNPGENLMMSIILTPHFIDIGRQAILNMAISLGIIDYLQSLHLPHITLKWPNDIYHKDQKLGGILIQNHLQGQVIKYSIVGIGLNINQRDFPHDLKNKPTSLSIVTEKSYDVKSEMPIIWKCIGRQYDKLKVSSKHLPIMREYNAVLYNHGKRALVTHYESKTSYEGTIGDVDLLGRLNIKDSEGNSQVLEHGSCEIQYLL